MNNPITIELESSITELETKRSQSTEPAAIEAFQHCINLLADLLAAHKRHLRTAATLPMESPASPLPTSSVPCSPTSAASEHQATPSAFPVIPPADFDGLSHSVKTHLQTTSGETGQPSDLEGWVGVLFVATSAPSLPPAHQLPSAPVALAAESTRPAHMQGMPAPGINANPLSQDPSSAQPTITN